MDRNFRRGICNVIFAFGAADERLIRPIVDILDWIVIQQFVILFQIACQRRRLAERDRAAVNVIFDVDDHIIFDLDRRLNGAERNAESIIFAEVGDVILTAVGSEDDHLGKIGRFDGVISAQAFDGDIIAAVFDPIAVRSAADECIVSVIFDGNACVEHQIRA